MSCNAYVNIKIIQILYFKKAPGGVYIVVNRGQHGHWAAQQVALCVLTLVNHERPCRMKTCWASFSHWHPFTSTLRPPGPFETCEWLAQIFRYIILHQVSFLFYVLLFKRGQLWEWNESSVNEKTANSVNSTVLVIDLRRLLKGTAYPAYYPEHRLGGWVNLQEWGVTFT